MPMKRSWMTFLLVGGLIALLAVLGGLQYRWLKQISESEGEKARLRVRENAERFALDFNREIQNAYFNFQTDAGVFRNREWTGFGERYDYWKANATYPDLIKGFTFIEFKADGKAEKYDFETKAFAAATNEAEVAELRKLIADYPNFRPIYLPTYTLLLPIHDPGVRSERILIRSVLPGHLPRPPWPAKYGHLAIQLDPVVLKDKLLADLNRKYFGDGEFRPAVSDLAGDTVYQTPLSGQPDTTAKLFDLSPENMIFYGNKDLMKTLGERKRTNIMIDQHVQDHGPSREEGVPGEKKPTRAAVRFEVKQDARERTSIFTPTTSNGPEQGPWTLSVQHISGSLDAHIASMLRRNLAFGFGLLLLLATSVGAIIISSIRARTLAHRQLDFVSSVSHEFRTPLAVIYSAGENLADGVAKEEAQVTQYGDLIKGEGRKLTAMVEQILDFAGAKSGKRQFSFVPTNVADVVDSSVAECRPMIDERGVELEVSVAEGLPEIIGDHAALSQALQNLIANSIKYGNGNAWVRVTATNGDNSVKVAVEDRGIGISKRDLKQIFEPFYRAKQVVDAQIHGNGLGLALVKQIVTAHGGSVSAKSEIGKGSKFMIDLPQR